MLLDEPTNHLDIETIDWLEQYLAKYAGAIVMVSHDRYILDRMTNTTAEVAQGKLNEYAGNYSFYLSERDERAVIQQAAFDNGVCELFDGTPARWKLRFVGVPHQRVEIGKRQEIVVFVVGIEQPVRFFHAGDAVFQLREKLWTILTQKLGRDLLTQLTPLVPFNHKIVEIIV